MRLGGAGAVLIAVVVGALAGGRVGVGDIAPVGPLVAVVSGVGARLAVSIVAGFGAGVGGLAIAGSVPGSTVATSSGGISASGNGCSGKPANPRLTASLN